VTSRITLNSLNEEIKDYVWWHNGVSLLDLKESFFEFTYEFYRIVVFILQINKDFKAFEITLLGRGAILYTKVLIHVSWVINMLYIRGRNRIKGAENLVIAMNIDRILFISEDLVFLYKLFVFLLLLSNKLSNKSFGDRSRGKWIIRSRSKSSGSYIVLSQFS
jgi:hypothetical protein